MTILPPSNYRMSNKEQTYGCVVSYVDSTSCGLDYDVWPLYNVSCVKAGIIDFEVSTACKVATLEGDIGV